MYEHDSLLFTPPIKDYIYVDPYTTELLDGSWVDSAWASECLDQDQVEVIYDTVSMEDELLSPLVSGNVYDYRHDCLYQANTPPSPLGLVCSTHLIQDCCECYQLHSPLSPSHFPTPLEVAAANLDMMMSLDVQNYYIDNTGSDGFGNIAVVQGGVDARVDLQW